MASFQAGMPCIANAKTSADEAKGRIFGNSSLTKCWSETRSGAGLGTRTEPRGVWQLTESQRQPRCRQSRPLNQSGRGTKDRLKAIENETLAGTSEDFLESSFADVIGDLGVQLGRWNCTTTEPAIEVREPRRARGDLQKVLWGADSVPRQRTER